MASTFRSPSLAIGKSAFTRNRCELLWLTLEPQFRDECMSPDARAPEYNGSCTGRPDSNQSFRRPAHGKALPAIMSAMSLVLEQQRSLSHSLLFT